MVSKKKKLYCHCFSNLLEYAIRRVQVNKDPLKLNGTHQILVYVDDVNILGANVHTITKNKKSLSSC
jgi:hypothetical protein